MNDVGSALQTVHILPRYMFYYSSILKVRIDEGIDKYIKKCIMYIVNNLNMVAFSMACVAAITLSLTACAVQPDVVFVTPSPTQAPSQELPAGYDELENWTNGEILAGFDDLSSVIGVPEIMIPYASYVDEGFIGVAPLETSCIVAFSSIASDAANGNSVSIAVLSRFDESLTEVVPGVALEDVKDVIDGFRTRYECNQLPMVSGTSA